MRTKKENRESIEPKSRLPVSSRQREERRKSTAGKVMRGPSPAVGVKRDGHPPKKRIDYFAYINDFLKNNEKEIPFPNRLKNYDPTSYSKAATGILSLIDKNIIDINRNSLEREFCDILDIFGYPYNVRDCVHSIPTNRNYQFTMDPLRWLVSLITTYKQYISIPQEEKMYDEQTKKWLQILNVFIEAYSLFFQARDEEIERLTKSALSIELENEEKINQQLQQQYQVLQEQLEFINKAFDTSIEGDVQALEIELQKKKSEFEDLVKKRDEVNNLVFDLERQIKNNKQTLQQCTQVEEDIKIKVKNLRYDVKEIEEMLQKPGRIRKEIELEKQNIEDMKKEINENEIKYRNQCEALALVANDLNGIADELNIGISIKINDDSEKTDELFGTNLDDVVQSILAKKPDICQIENENAKILAENNEIDAEMRLLKEEEEKLLSSIDLIKKESNGKDFDKVNKKLNDIQKENKKLTKEIQNNDGSVKELFTKLDDKFKSVSSHISSRFEEFLTELRKVQEEM